MSQQAIDGLLLKEMMIAGANLLEKNREAIVVADDENFSLAIGKHGMNSRLASRLTRYKIDIKRQKDAQEMGISIK